MKGTILPLLLTAMLTSCAATRPVALQDAKPVPVERVFAFNGPSDSSTGTVIVVRDMGHMGGGCPMGFYVDGELAAHVRKGESVALTIPAGNHVIGAGPEGDGICSWRNEATYRREVAVTVQAGATSNIRLAYTQDGTALISPTAAK